MSEAVIDADGNFHLKKEGLGLNLQECRVGEFRSPCNIKCAQFKVEPGKPGKTVLIHIGCGNTVHEIQKKNFVIKLPQVIEVEEPAREVKRHLTFFQRLFRLRT